MRYSIPTSRRLPPRPSRGRRLLSLFFWSLRILVVAALLAAGSWSWHWFKRPSLLPITAVAIQGSYQHIPQNTLQTIIKPYLVTGFLHMDIIALQQALLQLPWIDKASVSRVWPNKILITLTERQAVARWRGNALLDVHGTLFKPAVTSFPVGLPLLSGMDYQATTVWQQYQPMTRALLPLHLRIVELDLTPRQAWSLVLSNGTRVLLGRLEVMQRLNHFVKLYPKLFAEKNNLLESVDLRYPNGMSVRWRDGNN
jgi:cell division protein FtsQ